MMYYQVEMYGMVVAILFTCDSMCEFMENLHPRDVDWTYVRRLTT